MSDYIICEQEDRERIGEANSESLILAASTPRNLSIAFGTNIVIHNTELRTVALGHDIEVGNSFSPSRTSHGYVGMNSRKVVIGRDIHLTEKDFSSGASIFIGNANEICRLGIIESPTIESLQTELRQLRKDFEELKNMIDFHPDNEEMMENRKNHFDSLVQKFGGR